MMNQPNHTTGTLRTKTIQRRLTVNNRISTLPEPAISILHHRKIGGETDGQTDTRTFIINIRDRWEKTNIKTDNLDLNMKTYVCSI